MKKIDKNKLANYLIIALISIVALSLIRSWYISSKLSGKTKTEIAIIIKIKSGTGVKKLPGVEYFYYVKGKKYFGEDTGDFNFMHIGDTLLVKYSIDDNSISEVDDMYYMKKYKYLDK